ncbi:MAG: hypothetical protein KDB23_31615, partial [Planctomycetales bacterium]|nr:hypothetical protein [Planctomycetales bacterium]
TGITAFDRMRSVVGGSFTQPVSHLTDLQRRLRVAAWRHSSLLGLLYLIAQIFALCDFHLLNWCERWRRAHGATAPAWFTVLAELEALSSLAAVAHDEPEWTFPTVDPALEQFTGEQLGHPLIRAQVRVSNDVTLGPPETFLLVSGSNMSGKSTLLRSIGTNVILAQTGAPVCARECSLPPLVVATSMRIDDSLEDGVSFYMAELRRLKEIVDLAVATEQRVDCRLLYLLDEILLGTNSRERHVAVVRVMKHLLSHGAIGAISTHDLELAQSPDLQHACHCVHFREHFVEENGVTSMHFDYQMRPGIATTTNAIKLLEMVGLTERL